MPEFPALQKLGEDGTEQSARALVNHHIPPVALHDLFHFKTAEAAQALHARFSCSRSTIRAGRGNDASRRPPLLCL
jgi:hypothetical protein